MVLFGDLEFFYINILFQIKKMRFYISRCLSHCGISKVTEFGRQLIYLLLLMTINANHKDVVVKFNILKGSAVRLNADEITVVGTEQNIAGDPFRMLNFTTTSLWLAL